MVPACNDRQPYIIAEVGSNHNGDMGLAKEMIAAAREAGASAVKFQSWSPQTLVCEEEYKRNTSYADAHRHFGTLKEMCEAYYLRPSQHIELADEARRLHIDFLSSVFSPQEVNLVDECGVCAHKLASMDVDNLALLRYVAGIGKPVIISTGMATYAEVDEAVRTLRTNGCPSVYLLHCVSVYPAPLHTMNLNNLTALRTAFDCPVGLSDHTHGHVAAVVAVALGACIIEKHFTLDKKMAGWDHHISADYNDMVELVTACNQAHSALGSTVRTFSQAEQDKASYFRRSLVLTKTLPAGARLLEADLTAKRPGTGLPPSLLSHTIGRTLRVKKDADTVLRVEDLV